MPPRQPHLPTSTIAAILNINHSLLLNSALMQEMASRKSSGVVGQALELVALDLST
jgi:hypothetical protein